MIYKSYFPLQVWVGLFSKDLERCNIWLKVYVVVYNMNGLLDASVDYLVLLLQNLLVSCDLTYRQIQVPEIRN